MTNLNLFGITYKYIKKNLFLVILISVISLAFFLRIFEIEVRTPFGWDQVDNAWAAKDMIVDHNFPLNGMQAKGNSGVFIGPYYYYFVAFFYFLTDLDPVAAGLIAGITSLASLIIVYFITKTIFTKGVAIIAVIINGLFFLPILSERVQWPVNFIPIIGLVIFFSLYQITRGKYRYMLLLAFAFGFSLHIHFTSIFYPFIILFSLPFIPRNKEVLRYLLLSMIILIPFVLPIFLIFVNNIHTFGTASSYGNNYFHGLHLRRVIQLLPDSIIQFNTYFMLGILQFLWIPVFMLVYLYKNINKDRVILCYLIILFFLVPLLVMSTYSGEISDYYFMINRFLSLIIISYLIYRIFIFKNIRTLKIIVVLLLVAYSIYNINLFLLYKERNSIGMHRDNILREIKRGEDVEFKEGAPESYLFFYYTEYKSK